MNRARADGINGLRADHDVYPKEEPSPRGRTILPYAPEPVLIQQITREAPTGPVVTGLYRLWRAEDGRRCRLCPSELCTLQEAPELNAAVCVQLVEGGPLAGLPPAVTLRG